MSKFQVGEQVREKIHGAIGTVVEVWENLYRVKIGTERAWRIYNFGEVDLEFIAEKVEFT